MKSLSILLILLLTTHFALADKICGRVLAENGLNVRDRPSLRGEKLYKLDQGDTFVYYSDGNTGKFLEIKDGGETLRGEWIQIILYPKLSEEDEDDVYGYIFFHANYAEDDIGCEEFKHQLFEKDLYVSPKENERAYHDSSNEDSLRLKIKLELVGESLFVRGKKDRRDFFKKDTLDYTELLDNDAESDTLLVHLENGTSKSIISYPLGKDGYEDAMQTYRYGGYSKTIHQFLVSGNYYEGSDFSLYDKHSGKPTYVFLGMPRTSPSYTYLLDIVEAIYEGITSFHLYNIKDGSLDPVISYEFKNWIFENEITWLSENEAVLKVSSAAVNQRIFAYADDSLNRYPDNDNRKIQFIKMTILK